MIRLCLLMLLFIVGCTPGYQKFYSQVSPSKYTPVEQVAVFAYDNIKIKDLYNNLFSDFLIIGESSFIGPYENPESSVDFARSIGADVFITSTVFRETSTANMPITTPTSSTSTFNTYGGGISMSGTSTSYGVQTTYIPIQIDRYKQSGLFLRNVTTKKPLWRYTKADFSASGTSQFDGVWSNEKYKIEAITSGEKVLGFISSCLSDCGTWQPGDLKFSFPFKDNYGVYFMGNRSPMLGTFLINKFGHLEVDLASEETFSFARRN